MDKPRKIALFDMDGTLVDLDYALYEKLLSINHPDLHKYIKELNTKSDDLPDWIYNQKDMILRQPGFWERLPRLQLGFDILEICNKIGFEKHILTRGPASKPQAWAEKFIWCKRELPIDMLMTITQDKGLSYGRVLVDDFEPYIEQWLKYRPRGIVIMPVNKDNKNYKHKKVIPYTGSINDIKIVDEALQDAFNR